MVAKMRTTGKDIFIDIIFEVLIPFIICFYSYFLFKYFFRQYEPGTVYNSTSPIA